MDYTNLVLCPVLKGCYTSFAAIHITEERNSNVQAMMLSNGLSNPFGLWLGHVFYDCLVTTVVSIVVVAIYSAQKPEKVQFLGPLVRLIGHSSLVIPRVAR